jgi:hypothetical protein
MQDIQTFNILVSSPSDLSDERKFIQEHVEQHINRLVGKFTTIRFSVSLWETDSQTSISTSPQKVIDNTMPEYDIYLGILWLKFGTPTDGAPSGTVYEYERALQRIAEEKTHDIMFLFKEDNPSLGTFDAHEYTKVQDFKNRLTNDGVLYKTYEDRFTLSNLLNIQLASKCKELEKKVFLRTIKKTDIDRIGNINHECVEILSEILKNLTHITGKVRANNAILISGVKELDNIPDIEKQIKLKQLILNYAKSLKECALEGIDQSEKMISPFTSWMRAMSEFLTILHRLEEHDSIKELMDIFLVMRTRFIELIASYDSWYPQLKHVDIDDSTLLFAQSIKNISSTLKNCLGILGFLESTFQKTL